MSKTKCIIIEDNPVCSSILKHCLDDFKEIELIETYKCPQKAIENIHYINPDLIFLDIFMPGISGIELIKEVGDKYNYIIITGSEEFALESYELDVIDYILKPYSHNRISAAINRYQKRIQNKIITEDNYESVSYLKVKQNYQTVNINLDDIIYLESNREYVKIVTKEQEYKTKQSLTFFENLLPGNSFVRIHRSFIVANSKLSSFSSKKVQLGDYELPIGRSYKKNIEVM